jgi:hypothetical protein
MFCIKTPPWNTGKGMSDRVENLIDSKCHQKNPVAKNSARSVIVKGYFNAFKSALPRASQDQIQHRDTVIFDRGLGNYINEYRNKLNEYKYKIRILADSTRYSSKTILYSAIGRILSTNNLIFF